MWAREFALCYIRVRCRIAQRRRALLKPQNIEFHGASAWPIAFALAVRQATPTAVIAWYLFSLLLLFPGDCHARQI